jgi:di/tricarboxylate transporter
MYPGVLLLGIVIAITLILFMSNRVRLDLAAVLASLALAWLGLIAPLEAISGFASNAVMAMASVMILSYGIERTGITSRLARAIVGYAGRNESRIIATVSLTVGLISSVIQNVGAAALFLPALRRIGKQIAIPPSRLMMPMGFAAILGGTVTMIASGPLIVVNDLLRQAGAEPFGLFSVTPIGLPLLIAGVALFSLAGSRLLPNKETAMSKPDVALVWGIDYTIKTCTIPKSSPLIGRRREDLPCTIGSELHLLAIRNHKEITIAPSRYTPIEAGQELAFLGSEEAFKQFVMEYGCSASAPNSGLKEILDSEGFGFAELIVRPKASIIGKTMKDIGFRQIFSIEPLIHQSGQIESRADSSESPFSAGDVIVAFGSWSSMRLLASHQDLLLLTNPQEEEARQGMGWLAVLIFAASLALTATSMPISLALLTGAAAMIISGIVTADEAYKAIDWKTIVLIGCMIPFGIAMERTGMAELLSGSIALALAGAHPLAVMLAIAIFATTLSLIISNVAATVLLVPLVLATDLGVDPRSLALLVAVCAQNSFVLPTHQVNALLMDPGGYSIRDYLKAGSVMTILFLAIATIFMYVFI